MSFSNIATDIITLVKQDGTVFEKIKAKVTPKTILIFDEKLPLEEGDKIYWKLPNNLVETYVVTDRGYHSKTGGIQGHYAAKVQKEGSIKEDKFQSIINVYNANGPNSKININSTDNSINYNNDPSALFNDLKKTIETITENSVKEKSLQLLEELKESQNSSSFLIKYQEFIATLADHMTIIAPFIPALTQMIS